MSDISVSFSRAPDSKSFVASNHVDFLVAHGPFENILSFIGKKVWSPIVWKNNRRNKDNFLCANLVVLDFDSGEWTLKDAEEWCTKLNLSAIIGTSKSHQKEKSGKGPCDRFRVVLHAEETRSRDDFEYTMSVYAENIPCDPSCKDGGRYYFPCTDVVWTKFDGQKAKWLSCPYEETAEAKEKKWHYVPTEEMRSYFHIPATVWAYIEQGAPHGERHKAAYIIGCELTRRGFTEDEILKLMHESKSPLLNIGEGKDDVRRCIGNAAQRVRTQLTKGTIPFRKGEG